MRRSYNILVAAVIAVAVILILGLLAALWSLGSDATSVNALAGIAVATLTLAFVAVAFFQMWDNRSHVQEAQEAQLRPLLVPRLILPMDLWQGYPNREHHLDIQNVGNGVATNVSGVILPPAYSRHDVPQQFFLRLQFPLARGETTNGLFKSGGTIFTAEETIAGIQLGVPLERAPEPPTSLPNLISRRDRCVARLTISYRDMLGLKHASVFDLTQTGVWVCIELPSRITHDIDDLDREKGAQWEAVHRGRVDQKQRITL
jgi:hypothetical protein